MRRMPMQPNSKDIIEQRDAEIEHLKRDRDTFASQVGELLAKLEGSRGDFADLKQRLLAAELANEHLRGYLARVREDDTVREELLTVGDPEGGQQLVPKRKSEPFPTPDHFNNPKENRGYDEYGSLRTPKPPRHWVSY